MARTKAAAAKAAKAMTAEEREALISTMIELGARGPEQTSLMVRAANACGLTEVTDHIKKMRIMFKRFNTHDVDSEPEDKPTPRKKARKRLSKGDIDNCVG